MESRTKKSGIEAQSVSSVVLDDRTNAHITAFYESRDAILRKITPQNVKK